jgi:hypothetical protein
MAVWVLLALAGGTSILLLELLSELATSSRSSSIRKAKRTYRKQKLPERDQTKS